MSVLELVPLGLFSWDFKVLQDGSFVAEIDISSWREKGALVLGGSKYGVHREGLMSGRFILELNGTELASAEKPSAIRRSFTVRHEGKSYTLKAETAFKRRFVLLENDRQIGSITPTGVFTRKARVDLPDQLPLPVRVFMIWLAVILWKRDSDAAASSAGTGAPF